MTFHYTDSLIGIVIVINHNPYITGLYNPLYNPTNRDFDHCSVEKNGCRSREIYHQQLLGLGLEAVGTEERIIFIWVFPKIRVKNPKWM